MAILAVNAGSSTLKFSLHPLRDGYVMPSVLSGNIQGLEPQGAPEISWRHEGHRPHDAFGHVVGQPEGAEGAGGGQGPDLVGEVGLALERGGEPDRRAVAAPHRAAARPLPRGEGEVPI